MLGAVLEKVFKCSSINNMFEVGKKSVFHKVSRYKDTEICPQHFKQTYLVNYLVKA